VPDRPGAPSLGSASAPVTIQLFSDFQCPFCVRLKPTLEAVLAAYPGRVRVVWRNYPLPFHADARPAAEAALEAQAQGGDSLFWQMHEKLFENPRALDRASLERHAQELGLDVARFRQALDDHRHAAAIDADIAAADATGLSMGTPTCFVNGRAIQGAQPLDAFRAAIDRALAP
jgi:protein-disulfide isomerase